MSTEVGVSKFQVAFADQEISLKLIICILKNIYMICFIGEKVYISLNIIKDTFKHKLYEKNVNWTRL